MQGLQCDLCCGLSAADQVSSWPILVWATTGQVRCWRCRDAMEMVVEQLSGLVNALSETDVYVVRRVLRNLSHMHGRNEAAMEATR